MESRVDTLGERYWMHDLMRSVNVLFAKLLRILKGLNWIEKINTTYYEFNLLPTCKRKLINVYRHIKKL